MEELKKLYPMKFCALQDEYSWGSEEFKLADLGYRDSLVRDGWLAGNSLGELMDTYLDRVTGDRLYQYYGRQFPVCVRVLNGRKDELKAALTAAGIPVGVHYKPNHLLSLFRPAPGSLPLPVTEQLYGELVTLPMHPGLSAADVEHICDVITATLA